MSGIDYNLKKIKGIVFDVDGVLSPSAIPLSIDGEPMRMINVKDGYALQLAIKRGIKIAIITGGNTEAVRIRFESLGIKDIYMNAAHKLPALNRWIEKYGLNQEEIAYMGDDIPDIPAMREVGLPCCPNDAAWEVKQISHWISRFTGGYGCARDLIAQVLKSQGLWMNDNDVYGW